MCKFAVTAFAALYFTALALFVIGAAGLFGQEQDPLAGVFLILLGLPWILAVDMAPESAWPLLAALAPSVNLGLLHLLCRRRARR